MDLSRMAFGGRWNMKQTIIAWLIGCYATLQLTSFAVYICLLSSPDLKADCWPSFGFFKIDKSHASIQSQ
ncbi:hypothetical protein MP228_003110 [Amoeboaphelidium protococcarum]|nr:hypothetical protein MP228_007351 [Amoeboaphelidium protococcarum]KAI3650124.1 hypothetical protein MP228_005021 [Amoeboaphelidium protococcarum]KAI3651807.1 hypothetical protein MP228_003110 [Amoeboaphelidium protococcarum]